MRSSERIMNENRPFHLGVIIIRIRHRAQTHAEQKIKLEWESVTICMVVRVKWIYV